LAGILGLYKRGIITFVHKARDLEVLDATTVRLSKQQLCFLMPRNILSRPILDKSITKLLMEVSSAVVDSETSEDLFNAFLDPEN